MKQIFAIFLALCVLPCFSTYAWIGGPFSNNSYFSENGDDGVYEAVGVPSTPGINGVGIFRWAVTNTKPIDPSNLTTVSSTVTVTNPFTLVTTTTTTNTIVPASSNVFLGGVSQISHAWFIQGVSYQGTCFGFVNSGLGIVSATGVATLGTDSVSSGFTATISNVGRAIPVSRFTGTGNGSISTGPTPFDFNAFGSKVSTQVLYNGV